MIKRGEWQWLRKRKAPHKRETIHKKNKFLKYFSVLQATGITWVGYVESCKRYQKRPARFRQKKISEMNVSSMQ